ncbi:MAG: cysteine-rich KTR domain-containing protein [Synergistaceae bacterium]
MALIKKAEWILCPACQNKTRIKVHQDTVLLNFPLFWVNHFSCGIG